MNTRHLILAATALLGTGAAFADTHCSAAPQDTQAVSQTLRTLVDAGFTFERAKLTQGKCYELKGRNTIGQRVEIYIDPADGHNEKTETKAS